ncbi:MFS transporter [Nocardia rhizosphaerihabitans]|uniref:MFS transporter n=1 Tax=Nocardia rhizosphaerihabitans TaxID=1691570 RepID=UPI003672B9C1
MLLAFGIASLVSILVTGVLIDRHLRGLMIAANVCFGAAALALGLLASVPPLVFVAAAVWGLGFGGAATLLQTASAEAVGAAGDVAQSLIVTSWNVAIAAGAVMGGVLISAGTAALPWWSLALALIALSITLTASTNVHRRDVTPQMQAWIDEQISHFSPEDMEPAVRLMREFALKRHGGPSE